MDLLNTETLLYLTSNLFRIYVTMRFLNMFFNKSTSNKRIGIIAFSLYFIINSVLFLYFSSPYLNLFSNSSKTSP